MAKIKYPQEDFETFMIEIGQWEKVNGTIKQSGAYMTSESIIRKFKEWYKKKTK